MRSISCSKAKKNLSAMMTRVTTEQAPLTITHQNCAPCVLMPLELFDSHEETAYLLQSTANAKHLMNSIDELRAQ
ncbi:type II toxin-antitoxin system prevent-host-death family antitoxin [Pseudomonas reactans]|nr:type II toxin-antitoxin system prevent-host-death family antitoxin [Pseudomonas reactans]